jgi:ankyrin repeat protein
MIDFDQTMTAIMTGDLPYLERLAATHEDFPAGRDAFVGRGRTWLTNAIDIGPLAVVKWMLESGSPVDFEDDEGFPALHSAIDRDKPDRLEVFELLCAAGADVNARGINDWTPLHRAAARNDVEVLKILFRHGADPRVRTRIDDYATPLEEARILEQADAVRLLEQFG